MANPVNNGGVNAKVSVGNLPEVDVKIGGTARVSENHSRDAIRSVNENYAKNPNHAPPVGQAADRQSTAENQSLAGAKSAPPKETAQEQAAPPRAAQTTEEPATGEDAALVNRPQRGEPKSNASETGLANGRGHHKIPHQTPPGETPPIVILPNEHGNGNPKTGGTQHAPPIIIFPHGQGNQPPGGNQNLPPVFNFPNTNLPTSQPTFGVNYSVDLNLRAHGNQPYGVIRNVVGDILRQHDVYLSRPTINRLINHQTLQNPAQLAANMPREIGVLLQNAVKSTLALLDNSRQNQKFIHQISKEVAQQLRQDIQSARHAFLKNAELGAVHFPHLNAAEKLRAAIDRLPAHLPAKAFEQLQNHKSQQVFDGLLLARGFVVPGGQTADARQLVAFKSAVFPAEISITALRDFGNLVKVLIADTATAKTTANLDLAVQKFVRILLANNELGVLLATVNLASQNQNQGGLVSRTLALAQIYELINRLIQAGEKALREAAPDASRNTLIKEKNAVQPLGVSLVGEADDAPLQLNRLAANEAAGALRQFLEFNPAFVFDNSASAFHNPDDARRAQKDFVDLYHDDIAAWLESGKHRFVKDFDFDKPVGVVVERGSDDVYTAHAARFVLVRDGSVQGWHFLKSFLVK